MAARSAVYFAPNRTRPPSHPFTLRKAAKTKTKSVNPSPFTGIHPFTGPFTRSAPKKSSREKRHSEAFE